MPLYNSRMHVLFGTTKFILDDRGMCILGCTGDLSVPSFADLESIAKHAIKHFISNSPKQLGPKCIVDVQERSKQRATSSNKKYEMLPCGSLSSLLMCNNMTNFTNGFNIERFPLTLWEVRKQASFTIATFQGFNLNINNLPNRHIRN